MHSPHDEHNSKTGWTTLRPPVKQPLWTKPERYTFKLTVGDGSHTRILAAIWGKQEPMDPRISTHPKRWPVEKYRWLSQMELKYRNKVEPRSLKPAPALRVRERAPKALQSSSGKMKRSSGSASKGAL